MRRREPLRIMISEPETEAGRRELSRRAASIHAELVLSSIDKLGCSERQKRELLQAVMGSAKVRPEENSAQ